MAKRTTPRAPATDLSLLSDTDKSELSKAAKASLLEEMTQDARDAYFAQQKEQFRREQVPEDSIVNVTLDVPSYIPFIMLDGVQYFHGYTYPVPAKTRCVIFEQIQRAWNHQDEIDGRSRTEAYRRPSNLRIGPSHAGLPTRGNNGVVAATES